MGFFVNSPKVGFLSTWWKLPFCQPVESGLFVNSEKVFFLSTW
jgi:hypothetical protein